MEKKLECFRDFILENTRKSNYSYLSDKIVLDFVAMCNLMGYKTNPINLEGYYDLSQSSFKALECETLEKYKLGLGYKEVQIEDLYIKILQTGEEQFELKLTKTAIEHLKLTGKCKIL